MKSTEDAADHGWFSGTPVWAEKIMHRDLREIRRMSRENKQKADSTWKIANYSIWGKVNPLGGY